MSILLPPDRTRSTEAPLGLASAPLNKRARALVFAAGFAALSAAVAMWSWPVVSRAQEQVSPSLPAGVRARIDGVFQDLNKQSSPGCVLGVVREDRLVYSHGYGMASLELQVPLTPQTVLEIGSVSKQFTAASIFLLEHDGKLSIDDDVRKYIPELPSYGHPITIRELLHHTSGIRDCIALMQMSGIPYDDYATESDTLAMIVRQKELNFEPNTEYLYSNSGYFLLSQIVKRVSGKPLAQFAQERIFQPLGMAHTLIVDDHTLVIPGRSRTYAPRKGGGFQIDVSNWEQTGDGAVDTTVGDLARWAGNYDHPVVGGKRLVDELETQGVLNDGKQISYAAGLMIGQYRGLRRVSHGGSWQGFRAEFELYPDQKLSLITLCDVANADPGDRTAKVADILLAGKLAPEPTRTTVRMSAEQLRRYAGVYWSEQQHDVRRVELRAGKLLMYQGAVPARELEPRDSDQFALGNATVRFQQAGGRLQMVLAGGDEVLGRYEPARPSADQMRLLTGRYRSDELQCTWTVDVEGDKLILHTFGANPNRVGTDKDLDLKPAVGDVYTAGPYVIHFDSQGFLASIGRASGIRFARMAVTP